MLCKECQQPIVNRIRRQVLCLECKEKHHREAVKVTDQRRKERWLQTEQRCKNCKKIFYAERQRAFCQNCWSTSRNRKAKQKAHMAIEESPGHYIPKKKRQYRPGSLDWYCQQIEFINEKRRKKGQQPIDYGKYVAWEEGRIEIAGMKRKK